MPTPTIAQGGDAKRVFSGRKASGAQATDRPGSGRVRTDPDHGLHRRHPHPYFDGGSAQPHVLGRGGSAAPLGAARGRERMEEGRRGASSTSVPTSKSF